MMKMMSMIIAGTVRTMNVPQCISKKNTCFGVY